jgi:hypothetical protein
MGFGLIRPSSVAALSPRPVTAERARDPWLEADDEGGAAISDEGRLCAAVLTVMARRLLPEFFTRAYDLVVAPASVVDVAAGLPRAIHNRRRL